MWTWDTLRKARICNFSFFPKLLNTNNQTQLVVLQNVNVYETAIDPTMNSTLSSYFAQVLVPQMGDDSVCMNITVCADDAKCPAESLLEQLSPKERARKARRRRRDGIQRGIGSRSLPVHGRGFNDTTSHRIDRWESNDRDSDKILMPTGRYETPQHPLCQSKSASLPQVLPPTSRWDAERKVARADSDFLLLRPIRLVGWRQKSPKDNSPIGRFRYPRGQTDRS